MGVSKCNTDRSSRGNPGPSFWAFCIRDSLENLVFSSAGNMFHNTSLGAEAKVIEKGIEYCIPHLYLPLTVETDSLTMKRILDNEWKVPWIICLKVRRIKGWMELWQIQIGHIMIEGNQVANFLTNYVYYFAGTI